MSRFSSVVGGNSSITVGEEMQTVLMHHDVNGWFGRHGRVVQF